MTPKQKAAIDSITDRPEYRELKAMLPKLVERYPEATIGVFDLGHMVWLRPKPGCGDVNLAHCAGWGMGQTNIYTVNSLEHGTALAKRALRNGPIAPASVVQTDHPEQH